MGYKVLAINPGSTTTKIAVYDERTMVLECTIRHSHEEVTAFERVEDQLDWRRNLILQALSNAKFDVNSLHAVIGRGGLLHPIAGGVYVVNEQMLHDLRHAEKKHVCNIGAMLAQEIASRIGVQAFIADPPVVDEMSDEAHFTGLPECKRHSVFHALNHRATARLHCEQMHTDYDKVNLIVAHLGGGITVAAHAHGRIVDVNNGLDGDGPFALDRAGSIPSCEMIRLCYSGKYTEQEMIRRVSTHGGLVAYTGTTSVQEIHDRIESGDADAIRVLRAMCYTIAKQICATTVATSGQVDGIVLTGGIAHSQRVVAYIKERCSWIAPIYVYPGENELRSLAYNALLVLHNKTQAQTYA